MLISIPEQDLEKLIIKQVENIFPINIADKALIHSILSGGGNCPS